MAKKKRNPEAEAVAPELVFLVNPSNGLKKGRLALTTYNKDVFEKNKEAILGAGFRHAKKEEIEEFYQVSLEDYDDGEAAPDQNNSEQA